MIVISSEPTEIRTHKVEIELDQDEADKLALDLLDMVSSLTIKAHKSSLKYKGVGDPKEIKGG